MDRYPADSTHPQESNYTDYGTEGHGYFEPAPRWATTTDRASFNDADITRLLLVVNDKIQETIVADEDGPILEHRAIWENIGAQIETLRRYHVCCACLALVHEGDRDVHPCGPCTCSQPVVQPS